MEISVNDTVKGADLSRPLDALFVNAPLRDYDRRPRVNDFTLPVLGMGYIATYAKHHGFNVGVVDAEALGLGVQQASHLINKLSPRWAGFNLLAPTIDLTARIASNLNTSISIMIGGHQAKAMPLEVLADPRFARCEALVLGEAETRVVELLHDYKSRVNLPGVMWIDSATGIPVRSDRKDAEYHLAPDIDSLPLLDRSFLINDPYRASDGQLEATIIGGRGCPYDCSFCGASVSANQDVTIRTRKPEDIIHEMHRLYEEYGVTAFRFVDDLFLGFERFICKCMAAFATANIGERFEWDATGRINVLHRISSDLVEALKSNGCREIALGIESGSERLLKYMGKRINPKMIRSVVQRLTTQGLSVKGYFILGFPTETRKELQHTAQLIHDLWEATESQPGDFRASVFEFRPYPGTLEWHRLLSTGRYSHKELLDYTAVDMTDNGNAEAMRERDEFNFSVNQQFGETPLGEVRAWLTRLSREQFEKSKARSQESR